jgi:hypothetical protein
MALVHLVNKPRVSKKVARFLLLFLKYNFIVVYKPRKTHVVVDALLRLLDMTKPTSVHDQTTNVATLALGLRPRQMGCKVAGKKGGP